MKKLICLAVVLCASPASAHIEVQSPTARSSVQGDQKAFPCGGVARTGNPTMMDAGSTVDIQWIETIDHTGSYRISFMTDGENFPLETSVRAENLTGQPCMDDDNPVAGCTVLADQIPEEADMTYSIPVTLPNFNCDNCTLQVIQIMRTQGALAPTGTMYFRCIDINLINGSGQPDMGGGMPDMGEQDVGNNNANNLNNANNVNNQNPNNANNVNNANNQNENNANGTDRGIDSINGEGGCATTAAPVNPMFALLFLLGLVALRRR